MSSRNDIEAARRAGAGAPVPPLVWKFGGTSVADHDRLRAVAERMVDAQRSGRGVVAVLSAMGKSTDELVRHGVRDDRRGRRCASSTRCSRSASRSPARWPRWRWPSSVPARCR